MRCAQCETRNPVGNKFCRECGGGLAAPDNLLAVEEAARAEAERIQERVARLMTDAHALAEQNKLDQAILLAEEAADLMPHSTSAHSLLASLYERTGRREKAVAALERVVEINPKSAADRDKVERLQAGDDLERRRAALIASSATAEALAAAKRNNAAPGGAAVWLPIVAAGMVGAFVLGVGFALVHRNGASRHARDIAANSPIAQSQPASSNGAPAAVAAAPSSATTTPQTTAGAPSAAPPGTLITLGGSGPKVSFPPPTNGSSDPFSAAGAPVAAAVKPASSGVSVASSGMFPLPRPGAKGNTSLGFTLPPAPVKLIGIPTGSSASNGGDGAATSAATSGDTAGSGVRITAVPPTPDPGGGAAADTPAPAAAVSPAPAQPHGYIHITIRPPHGENSDTGGDGGSTVAIAARPPQDAGASPSRDNSLLRAQSLQSAGRYREAIGAYQSAISASPESAGAAYQGMALSQQRLGDESAARAAYRQAISAYQAQASAGKDAATAQHGIESCRAALEVLGG